MNREENEIFKLRRKADQAWEMAGLARQDGDKKDEQRWTDEARLLEQLIHDLK